MQNSDLCQFKIPLNQENIPLIPLGNNKVLRKRFPSVA